MKHPRIYASIFALLLLSSILATGLRAQTADTARVAEPVRGIQYRTAADSAWHDPLFGGVGVSFDLCGALMAAFTTWGQLEGAVRANFLNTWFPVFEMGLGLSDHTNEETDIHYRTHSPYFRVGCDYNVLKDHRSGNRLYAGVRYAFSPFKYDVAGPPLADPVYGGEVPFSYTGMKSVAHWGELVVGVDVKVWKFLHLGWSARYKLRFSERATRVGHAWYVPGYGKSGGNMLGGTFCVVFDL